MSKQIHSSHNKWTGNLGEWSEPYVLFDLIAEKKLNLSNSKIDKSNIYKLVSICPAIPPESISFKYSLDKQKVLIQNSENSNNEILEIDVATFASYKDLILQTLKTHKKGTFSIPEIVLLLKKLGFKGIKSPSKNKSDIFLSWNDSDLEQTITSGFSIKSLLGKNPLYSIQALQPMSHINLKSEFQKTKSKISTKKALLITVRLESKLCYR